MSYDITAPQFTPEEAAVQFARIISKRDTYAMNLVQADDLTALFWNDEFGIWNLIVRCNLTGQCRHIPNVDDNVVSACVILSTGMEEILSPVSAKLYELAEPLMAKLGIDAPSVNYFRIIP